MTTNKIQGLTWSGKAWLLRVRAISGSLIISKTKTVAGQPNLPPVAALELLKQEAHEELRRKLSGETVLTIGAYAPRWLEHVAARKKTEAFANTRVNYLERFILPRFDYMVPTDLKARHLEDWKTWLLEQRKEDGNPYAHDTLQTVWSTLRILLRYVATQADCRNPMDGLRFDVQGAPSKVKDVVDADELGRLVSHSHHLSADMRVMILVGFGLGLRFCELSALWWSDIDLDQGTLRIERSQVAGVVGAPKTEATRRLVYLPDQVVTLLRTHHLWQGHHLGVTTDLVFPSTKGGYRYPQVLVKPLALLCALAKIDKHLTAHCLRHTANSLLREVAGDVVVRAMIGHAATATDMTRRYSRVARSERLTAHAKAFGGALIGGGGYESPPAEGVTT